MVAILDLSGGGVFQAVSEFPQRRSASIIFGTGPHPFEHFAQFHYKTIWGFAPNICLWKFPSHTIDYCDGCWVIIPIVSRGDN